MIKEKMTVVTTEAGKQDVLIVREFNAPRELVFQAWTDQELYVKWMGPKEMSMTLEKFEPETGGSWKYIHRDKKGNEFVFHGVFHEIVFPEKIVQTFEFGGKKGHVALETIFFEDLADDKTRVTSHSVFQSQEDRDGMIGSGMESGIHDSYERLDELLATELTKG